MIVLSNMQKPNDDLFRIHSMVTLYIQMFTQIDGLVPIGFRKVADRLRRGKRLQNTSRLAVLENELKRYNEEEQGTLIQSLLALPQAAFEAYFGMNAAQFREARKMLSTLRPLWGQDTVYAKNGDYRTLMPLPYYQSPILKDAKTIAQTGSVLPHQINMLQLYPNWVNKFNDRSFTRRENIRAANRTLSVIGDADNPYFLAMSVANKARFNPDTNLWEGKAVDQLKRKAQMDGQKYDQTYTKSKYILQAQLTPQQVKEQAPQVIRDIVAANDILSSTGFGPISSKSLSLYAGRWIDQVTGRVRILPKASSDVINPTSLNQRLAFQQARLINNWNGLVGDIERYNRLKRVSAATFAAKETKRIKAAINPETVYRSQYARYFNLYTAYVSGTIPAVSARFEIADAASKVLQRNMKYDPKTVTQANAQTACKAVDNQIIAFIENVSSKFAATLNPEAIKAYNALVTTAAALVSYPATRIVNGYKKVLRSTLIPKKGQYDPNLVEKSIAQLQSVNKQLRDIESKQITDINAFARKIGDIWAQKLEQAPSTVIKDIKQGTLRRLERRPPDALRTFTRLVTEDPVSTSFRQYKDQAIKMGKQAFNLRKERKLAQEQAQALYNRQNDDFTRMLAQKAAQISQKDKMIAQFELERAKRSSKQAPKEEIDDDDDAEVERQPDSRISTRSAVGPNPISKVPKAKNSQKLSKKDRERIAGVR